MIIKISLNHLHLARWCSRLLAVCLLALSAQSLSQTDAKDRIDVSLVSIGPGQTYWQRFGHNAILIKVRGDAEDPGVMYPGVMYNYGLFDFQQRNFLLNFMRGRMNYSLGAFYADQNLAAYVKEDRDVTIQKLNLNFSQKRQLVDFLEWNRRPENAAYRYDYFRNNCSTKVRDALDRILAGALKDQFAKQASSKTLRYHVQRLTAPDLALYLGVSLGLGQSVDLLASRWEEFFLPMELLRGLDQVVLADGKKLVQKTIVVHRSTQQEPEIRPDWMPRFLLVGLLLAGVLGLIRDRPKLLRRTVGAWYLLCGLAGLTLALLLLSDHQAAWYNENLLLFSPLGLLAAGPLLLGRVNRFALNLATLIAAIAVLGVALKFNAWMLQDNLEFVAIALPIHLVCLGLLIRQNKFG